VTAERPRLFLDGVDATTFLFQHGRMVEACELSARTMKDEIAPQLREIHLRLGSVERQQEHATEDRAELARLSARVGKIEARQKRRASAAVTASLITALAIGTVAGAAYYFTHDDHSKGTQPWASPTP
jgi:BMFP domain-containing protein YqiC